MHSIAHLYISVNCCNAFCAEHAKLFFGLLRSSPIPTVRNNLMIAAGDLCFRFPNTVEQYCERLYERIHDQDQAVRQTCLLVLTHLILNDMIKVKGCVADVAQCTLDSRPQMAGLAKLFFQEMAQKGNAIYNLMPDIISRLSDPKTGVEKEQFKEIMKFLLRFIQTEKQNEMLVEKFCQRFQSSKSSETEGGPWQYLSFCLTQLTLNEKAFRKLVDNVQCFGDKLSDTEVYENFCIALASCKKSCKTPELKHEIEDFEETLKMIHEQGFEAEEAAERAKEFKNRTRSVRKTPARSRLKTPKQSPRKKIKCEIDSPTLASPSP
uniref:Condensin complex subunit 1 C-terminal domain-containing protein n=1 Tax=Plectus sambesii TaxID=2011161 RepID=A0A914UTH6_9BILA